MSVAFLILARASELDGLLIEKGKRLTELSIVELMNYTYADLMKDADREGRKKIEALFAGRLGAGGGIIVDDPTMPENLRGQEAPSWWNDDHDPFTDMHTLSNVE